jgi:hypothetical protein
VRQPLVGLTLALALGALGGLGLLLVVRLVQHPAGAGLAVSIATMVLGLAWLGTAALCAVAAGEQP